MLQHYHSHRNDSHFDSQNCTYVAAVVFTFSENMSTQVMRKLTNGMKKKKETNKCKADDAMQGIAKPERKCFVD